MARLCECGCGEAAPIAPRTYKSAGWVKGEPLRFVKGHHQASTRPSVVQPEDKSIKLIALTKGKVAIVDAEDYERLMTYLWYALKAKAGVWYAITTVRVDGKKKTVSMHRMVMNASPGAIIDHRLHNTLDNRKSQLRFATGSQNCANQRIRSDNVTGFKGVSPSGSLNKPYRASITHEGKKKHLGRFEKPEEAHAKYVEKAKELFQEFACAA